MEKLAAILIVEDDADVRQAAAAALAPHVTRIETAPSPDAMAVTPGLFDCVLLDMNFVPSERGGRAGMDAMAAIKAADPALAVVLMTGYGGVSLAVEALKRGAEDFLLKPWRNEALVGAVRAAAARTAAGREETSLDTIERATIQKALARHDGNIAQAAASLGLSRPALYRRLSKHGL
jgi:DNA-binding NtrC family response regulator